MQVVRESSGDNSAEVKAIEIPPPRPKRKPMRPYPRKLSNSASMLVMEKPKWSFIPKVAVSVQESLSTPKLLPHEEDNQAPASVLSAVESNTFSTGSPASDLMSSCVSPVSSAVGSDPVGTSLSNQENGCQSATTSVDDEDKSLMLNGPNMVYNSTAFSFLVEFVFGCYVPGLISLCFQELYSGTDASVSCKEALSVEAPASSLKLFGKTMVVPGPHEPSCSSVADAEQCHQSPSYATGVDSHSGNLNTIQHMPDQVHKQSATDGTPARPSGEGRSPWNLWSGGPTPMFYMLPTHGNVSDSAEASVASMPWMLAFCGGALPFVVPPQNLYSEQDQLPSSSDNVECNASSCVAGGIGSSGTSVDGAQNLNMSSKLIPSKTSAFRSLKATSNKPPSKGGFVPYRRRCVPEKKVDHQKMCSENGEGQGMQLCL